MGTLDEMIQSDQLDNSGSSTGKGGGCKRPPSYILLFQEMGKGAAQPPPQITGQPNTSNQGEGNDETSEQRETKRSQCCKEPNPDPGGHRGDGSDDSDSNDGDGLIPWTKGPDPRNRDGDNSDDDYKEDPFDLYALRQRQLGNTDPRYAW